MPTAAITQCSDPTSSSKIVIKATYLLKVAEMIPLCGGLLIPLTKLESIRK